MKILKNFLKNNDSKPTPLQKTVENVQSVIEETDSEKEIARKKAIDVALKEIQEHKDMPVGKFMQMLQEKTSLTDEDLVTIITQIPDVKSEKATIAAVQSTSLSPENITSIVKEADISLDTAEKIVNEIDNEAIQKEQQAIIAAEREQQILSKLSEIHKKCDSIEDPKLVEFIEKLDIKDYTTDINKKLMAIISKRTALDCMKFGGPRLPTLTRILPAEDMFEADLPFLAFSDYKALKVKFDDDDKKYTEFTDSTKKLIRAKILEEIAKKTAETYDSTGNFFLPQTEKFKKLSNDDIHLFEKTVKTYSKDFDKSAGRRLRRQLSGEAATELHDLNRMLEKMNPAARDLALQKIVALLQNDLLTNKSSKMNNELSNTLEEIELAIRKLPAKSQLPAAQTILDTLNQRNEATLLLKNAKKSTAPSHQDDDEER